LKILLAHNFYGSAAPSGENSVYLAEKELLKSHEHSIIEFSRHSDEIRDRGFLGKLQGGLVTPWNPFTAKKIRQLLKTEKPDILHVHNTFPLLSPSIFHAVKEFPTATVLTLHNYRIFCAAAIPMRNSNICTECLEKQSIFPALKYGCYRESRLNTLPLTIMIGLHRRLGTWSRLIDAFIALTEFQKDKMVKAGLPAEVVHVKPHFYPDPPLPLPWREREEKIVFIGRMGKEKGVHILIEAWRLWGESAPKLEMIGEGPEWRRIRESVHGTKVEDKITFLGQLPFSKGQELLAKAKLLVLPSLCFEGFPMVIREAFALGVPVAASRIGAIPFIIKEGINGVMFKPGDSTDLLKMVKPLWENSVKLSVMAEAARKEFEEKYTADTNYDILMEIYREAILRRKKKLGILQDQRSPW
jgi:glycosyltransferase involved in cell wall biosynthesis